MVIEWCMVSKTSFAPLIWHLVYWLLPLFGKFILDNHYFVMVCAYFLAVFGATKRNVNVPGDSKGLQSRRQLEKNFSCTGRQHSVLRASVTHSLYFKIVTDLAEWHRCKHKRATSAADAYSSFRGTTLCQQLLLWHATFCIGIYCSFSYLLYILFKSMLGVNF